MTPAAGCPAPVRTADDVAAWVAATMRLAAPGTIGAELEFFAHDEVDPLVRPPVGRVTGALAGLDLPGRSLLSIEPGGQVELSSAPLPGPQQAVDALAGDLLAVRTALAGAGVVLRGGGTDPARPPVRLVDSPRYECMEAFFRADGGPAGEAGRAMMCSTAAVQVSVDAGLAGTGRQSATARWQRAHAVGPALVAAFACSPLLGGRRTGWRSTRQELWARVDPSRTRAPRPDLGPVEAVTQLAMSARLLAVRDEHGRCVPAPRLTFGEWVAGRSARRPDVEDLRHHLTTLFPPVRARGWFELRYLDGLPDPLWQVAVAAVAALLDDDRAADQARAACEPVEGRWAAAARVGTADPALARAATACLEAAAQALPRLGAPALADAVGGYAQAYPARGRCPADDLLDDLPAGHAAAARPRLVVPA